MIKISFSNTIRLNIFAIFFNKFPFTRYVIWNILIFFIISPFALSQDNQIRFDHISIEQGLSQSSVYSIAQDQTGFMWFATEDGLNRYDGYTFTVYTHDPVDTNSISDIGIQKLFIDRTGNLWVITFSCKLNRYDQEHDSFIHYDSSRFNPPDKGSTRISSIAEDSSGQLWICSGNCSLYRYDPGKDQFVFHQLNENNKKILSGLHAQYLYADESGVIWFGTWEGLIKYDIASEKLEKYQHLPGNENSLGGNMVFDITEDERGNLWIATSNGGVSVLNKKSGKFKVFRNNPDGPGSLSSDRVVSIFRDKHSNIWIGTIDKGLDLLKKDDDSFINYHHVPSISSSISSGAVISMYEDRSGTLWLGTLSGGINRFNRKSQHFLHISHNASDAESISQNTVLSLCEDHTGALWVGTDGGGLNLRLPGSNSFKHYLQNPSGFGSNSITAVYEDRSGKIWVGTDPGANTTVGGVLTFDRESDSFIPYNKIKMDNGGITTFYQDSFGDLWIGTSVDGLRKIISGKDIIKEYKYDKNNPGSISGNSVFAVYEDKHGDLWVGTIGRGVNRFDRKNDSFKSYINELNDSNSISKNSVWCLGEDIEGNLWMGTWGGGLNKFDRKSETFRSFSKNDGLPSNVIYGIVPDKVGNIWLSTSRGIAKFNTQNNTSKVFDNSDGLQNIEFNQGAYCVGKDGSFYFGGTNGVTAFYPENIKENKFAPPTVLTSFRVFDKPLALEKSIYTIDEIKLSYKQNFFSFEFAALDYTAPEKNRYAYMLDGVDKDWVFTGSRRYASYTDISPGEYTFHVKGTNNDGVWSVEEATVQIIISPPFWETWWFRILVVLFFAGLLYSFHRYRLNKLLEVERTRVKIARDLHDEVSATITGIVYFSNEVTNELAEKSTPMLTKLLTLIKESATEVQEAMSDIIWSINPENDKLEVVLPKFRRFASDLCESRGIKYNIQIPESFSGRSLDMEWRRNLWLIFKEIVTNAVKHSDCSELLISIDIKDSQLELHVIDNGKGFDPDKPTDRNGVKNIHARTKTLKGVVNLKTAQGKGTEWKMTFPL